MEFKRYYMYAAENMVNICTLDKMDEILKDAPFEILFWNSNVYAVMMCYEYTKFL